MDGQEHYLIKNVLDLLGFLRDNGLDMDRLLGPGGREAFFALPGAEALRTAYEAVRFMEEMPGGFFIYRAGGDEGIIYANRGLLRILQCGTMGEFQAFTGGSFRGIVCPEDLDKVEQSIQKQISEGGRDLDYVSYRVRRRDGTVRWVEDYGHFIRAEGMGDVFYVFLGDSTDERSQQQTEQQHLLAEALEKANLAVQAKNTFLSNISHEMRTPLNAVFGFTSLAKLNLHDPDAVKGYLNRVESSGRELLDMITQVLDISALSSAAGPAEVECDLCGTVREVHGFLLPQAKEKSIAFSLDCEGVTHSGIYADQEKLRQLVLNLANNAVTYTKPGGRVSITLTEEGALPNNYAAYRLVVEDNGIGISEEFLKRIFEPFSREKNSTLNGVRGIGLGLTIAKNIAELMGGSIDVKSAVNQGSTFTVTLHFRIQPVPAAPSEISDVPGPSRRILLVEDNEINLEIETELLERMGFVIDPAENGKIALEKMEQAAPGDYDLIIMDIQMPVMDGWQASAAIRQLPDPTLAHIPIIALSANVLASDRRRSLEAGINVHLPKPMDLPVLLDTIEEITKRHTT